jgi:hypothetical protein
MPFRNSIELKFSWGIGCLQLYVSTSLLGDDEVKQGVMIILFCFMEVLATHVQRKQPHDLVDKELGDKLNETKFWYKNNPFLVGKP